MASLGRLAGCLRAPKLLLPSVQLLRHPMQPMPILRHIYGLLTFFSQLRGRAQFPRLSNEYMALQKYFGRSDALSLWRQQAQLARDVVQCCMAPLRRLGSHLNSFNPFRPNTKVSELPAQRSPYSVGERLAFCYNGTEIVEALVVQKFTFTLSCVVLVRVWHKDLPALCVLKVFDRRFAPQLREDYKADPWDSDIERGYHALIATGKSDQLFGQWIQESQKGQRSWLESSEQEARAELETYLQFMAWRMYGTETRAYDHLQDIQGCEIPKIYGEIRINTLDPMHAQATERFTTSPGLLMEYVPGFSMNDFETHADPAIWTSMFDQAQRTIVKIGDRGVCNRDVQFRSFIIQARGLSPIVAMVDFGLCFFREDAIDDEDWEETQAWEFEEDYIGSESTKRTKGAYDFKLSPGAQKRQDIYLSENFVPRDQR